MDMTTAAEKFFYEYAGYSFNPKTQTADEAHRSCARAYARAEEIARLLDFRYQWADDWEIRDHQKEYGKLYKNGGPETCEQCTVYDRGTGRVLASLHCIDDASSEYRRVVQAELAMEALTNYFKGGL